MVYESEWQTIVAASNTLTRFTRQLAWALERTPLPVIGRSVAAWFERLVSEHENVRVQSEHEHERIKRERMNEERKSRELAAQVARYHVEPGADALYKRLHTYVERRRHDTSLSFPDAFDRFDGPAMVQVAILKEQRRAAIEAMKPGELLSTARRAFESKNALGFVDFGLVEERLQAGRGTSRQIDDGPVVRELSDFISAVQDLRIEPRTGIETVTENINAARKTVTNADMLKLAPINPTHHSAASAAFTSALNLYEEEAAANQ